MAEQGIVSFSYDPDQGNMVTDEGDSAREAGEGTVVSSMLVGPVFSPSVSLTLKRMKVCPRRAASQSV